MADDPDLKRDSLEKALDRMALRRRDVRFYSAETGERLTDRMIQGEAPQKPGSVENFLDAARSGGA